MKTRLGVALLATLGTGLIATPAQAASIGVVSLAAGDDTIRYTAAAKTANKVVVTRSGRTVTIDDRVRLKAGKGCKAVKGDSTKVRCTFAIPDWNNYEILARLGDRADSLVAKGKIRVVAYGGSGADSLSGGSTADQLFGESGKDRLSGNAGQDHLSGGGSGDTLSGGTGADRLYGGTGADVLDGGSADDILLGESSSDTLRGGSGNDRLDGGTGSDKLGGGTGTDTASYASRKANVVADLDGVRDDGAAGERDTIGTDVEGLIGGLGNDTLTGDGGANKLGGGSGADVLRGGGGNDFLNGEGGKDTLDGGSGDDHLIPDFTETESGDDGPDVIDPIAADVVRGGSGTDTVDYSDRQRNPVVVDLDGQAGDDGRAGEGDTVGADVENLLGTIYADTLTGNDSANEIRGSGGNDVLAGLGGADRLFGAEGDDDLSGQDTTGDQADHLDGGSQYTAAGDLCRAFPLDVVVGCER